MPTLFYSPVLVGELLHAGAILLIVAAAALAEPTRQQAFPHHSKSIASPCLQGSSIKWAPRPKGTTAVKGETMDKEETWEVGEKLRKGHAEDASNLFAQAYVRRVNVTSRRRSDSEYAFMPRFM